MTTQRRDHDEALIAELVPVIEDSYGLTSVYFSDRADDFEQFEQVVARAVLAHLAATGRLVGEGATFPAPRVSIRPDGGVIRALLMSEAPLSEADTLRAAAQRLAIAAQAHRDISDDDPAAQQVSTAYQEAADVLAHWAESGRVPRLGPNGRAKWRGTGEEVTGG